MRCEVKQFESIQYIIRYPKGYQEGTQYPVILAFHGAGGRGTDLQVLRDNPFFTVTDQYEEFPFVSVAPLCSAETWFDLFETVKRLLVKISQAPFADVSRIYLMGASMGGYCTWQLAMSMPEYIAAIAPICGGGMYWNAGRLVNIPVWAFHGKLDQTVFVEESVKMVEAVNRCGGNAKLTIYPENQHDAWNDTYGNPEVFQWLLTNVKK